MSSASKPFPGIPSETFRAARKVYNLQHVYLRIGDRLADLYPRPEWLLMDPALRFSPEMGFRLGLVSGFQFAESLPDPSVSEATLRRLDWKYALALPITHPGLTATALCAFRQALYSTPNGLHAFKHLLSCLGETGLSDEFCDPVLDPVEILSVNCMATHLDELQQALYSALSVLASSVPDWMRVNVAPHWYERYQSGVNSQTQSHSQPADQRALALALGADIHRLLDALAKDNPHELAGHAETRRLKRLWERNYSIDANGIYWHLPECACGQCSSIEEPIE